MAGCVTVSAMNSSERTATSPPPVFIVGCGRSGTTLLQALIDNHPNIAVPPESHVYARFGCILHCYGDLAQRRNRRRLIAALLRDAYIRDWRLSATVEDLEQRLRRADFPAIIDALFSTYAEMRGAKRWGDKTPLHIRHLREIRHDFPQAKLIHLVRDGRDVAEAMRRMIFHPVTAVGLARTWRDEVTHWKTFCEEFGSNETLLLRYEKMVASPGEVMQSVLSFIGEPYVDTVSTYAHSSLSQKLHAEDPWHASLRDGIGTSKIGVYRLKFTPREIEILEAISGDALESYGYNTDNDSPRPPTSRERAFALVADRLVRWRRKLADPRIWWREMQFHLRRAYRLFLAACTRQERQIGRQGAGADSSGRSV